MELVFIVIIEHQKLLRCSGSASFFLKKKLANKKMGRREYFKKNLKTYRRDDYVKSLKKIYTNKKHTHKKKIKDFLLTKKKEKIREIDTEKKNTTIKKILHTNTKHTKNPLLINNNPDV